MPIAMSNYANRQSPNQQAKIASMLNAAAQSQRPDQGQADALMGGMNFMGPAPPDQRPSSIGPYTGDRPSRRSYRDFRNITEGPPPIMDQSGRPDQFGGLRQGPPMPSPMQGIGPAPEFEKRPYTGPGPTPAPEFEEIRQYDAPPRMLDPITQGPPISQSLGRMQQQPPTIRDQGLRPDPVVGEPDTKPVPEEPSTKPSAEPEANRRYKLAASSPSAGTQYGEDIAGRPAPQSVHRVANRSIGPVGSPEGWFGTDFMKGVGYYPPQDTYLTLDPSEQYALQQNGYIDRNGLRYAKNDYGEIVNIGSTPGRDTGGLGYVRPLGAGEF